MTDITELALITKIKKQLENFDTVILKEDEALALVEALEKAQADITKERELRVSAENRACEMSVAELVTELETAQQVDDELCKLLPPGVEYMDPPDGGDVTPLEGVRRMVADYRQRLAELEPIRAAAERLVRCKGRYHSELNYRALATLFGVNNPDLPPLDGESRTVTAAAADVLAERKRQVSVEGWTPSHDDTHKNNEMAFAASCYAFHAAAATWDLEDDGIPYDSHPVPKQWPWDPSWWKPTDARRDLVKAGALILAEIERIDRADGIKVEDE
ncbi:hypothetical protein [Raoultella ornithinolytica]|uniref:Ead/Ea22-like family protein n=1 Tax=Raoultella ornithinolytica TaxID=54291 RepID=A0A9Q9JEW9_RAOOR|nr:hypothetical protein [Raoultella ornithinolytica]UXE40011.1 hypothetical protein N2J37_09865 [Raoultella ornithinolytica]